MNNYFIVAKGIIQLRADEAECYGKNKIEEWAKDQYKAISNDVRAMAAFVTVLNHKCWYWYDNGNQELSKVYSNLYYKYDDLEWNWLKAHGTEEEKNWYFKILD